MPIRSNAFRCSLLLHHRSTSTSLYGWEPPRRLSKMNESTSLYMLRFYTLQCATTNLIFLTYYSSLQYGHATCMIFLTITFEQPASIMHVHYHVLPSLSWHVGHNILALQLRDGLKGMEHSVAPTSLPSYRLAEPCGSWRLQLRLQSYWYAPYYCTCDGLETMSGVGAPT